MKKCVAVIMLFICYSGKAQINKQAGQVVDESCNCPGFFLNDGYFQPGDIKLSTNEIEIRQITHSERFQNITIITYNHGKYEANFYSRARTSINIRNQLRSEPFKKFKIENVKLDSIVNELMFQNVLGLPNQREIQKEYFYAAYRIEYKFNNHYHLYVFDSPERYILAYPNVKEYKNYSAIIALFYNLRVFAEQQP